MVRSAVKVHLRTRPTAKFAEKHLSLDAAQKTLTLAGPPPLLVSHCFTWTVLGVIDFVCVTATYRKVPTLASYLSAEIGYNRTTVLPAIN
jgi:hypothetical protein